MKHAVSKVMLKCFKSLDLGEDFKKWILDWPTQFILVALEVTFTNRLKAIFPPDEWNYNYTSEEKNRKMARLMPNTAKIRKEQQAAAKKTKQELIKKKQSKKILDSIAD